MMAHYDVIVIGCGPAGQKAAIKCAKAGRRTAIIDERQVVGGQALHIGTIPSKTLREAIIYLSGHHQREIYGSQYRLKSDLTVDDLLTRCRMIIEREIDVIHNQLTRNGVSVISGFAKFTGPHSISVYESVGCMELTADYFVIATGTISHNLQGLPIDGMHVMNSDDIMRLPILPKRLMIVGAGVIGLEYAAMFALLDIKVTLVSQYSSLLPFVDRELVEILVQQMERNGVTIRYNEEVEQGSVKVHAHKVVSGKFKNGGDNFEVDLVMYCGARWGNVRELNLDAVGLVPGQKDLLEIEPGSYRTSVPYIYAAGDVIGFPQLASTSIDQGRKAANQLLGQPDVGYQPIFPYGIYTYPEISMVGASEQQLQKDNIPYLVGIGRYRDTARGQIMGDSEGLLKILFAPDTRKVLGVHAIGREATELIHLGQAVMIFGGVLDYFVDTVFNYPTLGEAYKLAGLNGLNEVYKRAGKLEPMDVFGNAVPGASVEPPDSTPDDAPSAIAREIAASSKKATAANGTTGNGAGSKGVNKDAVPLKDPAKV
jgi:NAD(P) transhydrogenase